MSGRARLGKIWKREEGKFEGEMDDGNVGLMRMSKSRIPHLLNTMQQNQEPLKYYIALKLVVGGAVNARKAGVGWGKAQNAVRLG